MDHKGKNVWTFVYEQCEKPGNWVSSDRVVALGTVFLSFTCHYRVGSTRKHIPTEMPEDWGQLKSLSSIHILIAFRSTSCLLWL